MLSFVSDGVEMLEDSLFSDESGEEVLLVIWLGPVPCGFELSIPHPENNKQIAKRTETISIARFFIFYTAPL